MKGAAMKWAEKQEEKLKEQAKKAAKKAGHALLARVVRAVKERAGPPNWEARFDARHSSAMKLIQAAKTKGAVLPKARAAPPPDPATRLIDALLVLALTSRAERLYSTMRCSSGSPVRLSPARCSA